MKKVLVVFPLEHHKSLVMGQCKCLNEKGISADALLIQAGVIRFYSQTSIKVSYGVRFLSYMSRFLHNIRGYYRLGIGDSICLRAFCSIVERYDVVEFAGVYTEERLVFAESAKVRGKKVIVRVWGSDFYGINDYKNNWQNCIFRIADKIVLGTDKMKDDFINAFPALNDKLYVEAYGLGQLETLKDVMAGVIHKDTSFLNEDSKGRIVLTIGYTGRPWQQHFYVLDALEKLSPEQKSNLFILVPMTYDSIPDYRLYIYKRLQRIGVPFQILDKRLSLIQNLSMRLATDIFICIQFSDALAASVQEHLMARSVFIGGDWLPYKLFLEKGIYYRPSSLIELSNNLVCVIENLQEEKRKCANNNVKMYDFSSWKKKGEAFVRLYDFV